MEAKARTEKKSFIAVLKALRHPKASSANCKAGIAFAGLTARPEATFSQARLGPEFFRGLRSRGLSKSSRTYLPTSGPQDAWQPYSPVLPSTVFFPHLPLRRETFAASG
jgi:hypothetical protein